MDFGDAFASEKAFLKLAQTLEDTGVSAYNGAGPMIKRAEVLGAAGSIVQIEARHAAPDPARERQDDPRRTRSTRRCRPTRCSTAVKPFVK